MSGSMLGVFDLRGRMLPIYSPARALGVAATGRASAAILVSAARRVALAIDDVDDVLEVESAALAEPPGGKDPSGLLLAVLRREDHLISVIDAAVLLAACLAEQERDENADNADRDVEP
jgi:chemotaxis signal transduction protein